MEGISSKALTFGDPENKKNKFQNQEFDDVFDIDYYEFKYREHDPQIGRFIQIDPLANKYPYNSTYAFSENKVINGIELEGLEVVQVAGTFDWMTGFLGGEFSLGFAFDKSGVHIYGSTGVRIGFGEMMGFGGIATYYPNMPSTAELEGFGWDAGVSGGFLGYFGAGVAHSNGYYGYSVTAGFGLGVQSYVGGTITGVSKTLLTWKELRVIMQLSTAADALSELKSEAIGILDKAIAFHNEQITSFKNQIAELDKTIDGLKKEEYSESQQKKIMKAAEKINNYGQILDILVSDIKSIQDYKKKIIDFRF